ncbi:MAG: HD-GYP domain-containing protein [Acidobacteria bacterium]|nr:HD-GYP domain-containing protein [Acidobacteriota bacterium]
MKKPPRLVARTLAVTFITSAAILSVVFTVLTVDARDRVRAAEIEKLRVAERVFTALEARRQQEQLAAIATLAENPTLKAALDVGAIRALAAAPDARDPYTAGHSERVSALSVLMGRQMLLGAEKLEILRLGALLHDVGKIGVSDEVLRKPGVLTSEEFEQLKRHPALGARILRQVPFLTPHVPIVELHHERPDGGGYPFGLRGDEIPVAARIVHVADAFDAITSARAYRPARGAAEALAELRRHAGTQFDPASVDALAAVLPEVGVASEPARQELLDHQMV